MTGVKLSRKILLSLVSNRVHTISKVCDKFCLLQFTKTGIDVLARKVNSIIPRNSSWGTRSLRIQKLQKPIIRRTHPIRREAKGHTSCLGQESVISFVKSEKYTLETGIYDFLSFTNDLKSDLYDYTVTVEIGTTRGPSRSADTRHSADIQVGRIREPVDPAPARSGSSKPGAATVFNNATRGNESPDRPAESSENYAVCPECGEPVLALVTSGPSSHSFAPCGCSASTATARDLAGDSERRALADGGEETADQLTRLDCPNCEDAIDARYLGTAHTDEHDGHIVGWECTECNTEVQEHVDCRGSSFDLRVVGNESGAETESDEIRTDGGFETRTLRVGPARTVAYGPAGANSGEWALRFTSEDGDRVVVRLEEDSMYELWTEVHNVPWPSREDSRHDLQREIVARAERADEEMLRDVLDVLGGEST